MRLYELKKIHINNSIDLNRSIMQRIISYAGRPVATISTKCQDIVRYNRWTFWALRKSRSYFMCFVFWFFCVAKQTINKTDANIHLKSRTGEYARERT